MPRQADDFIYFDGDISLMPFRRRRSKIGNDDARRQCRALTYRYWMIHAMVLLSIICYAHDFLDDASFSQTMLDISSHIDVR